MCSVRGASAAALLGEKVAREDIRAARSATVSTANRRPVTLMFMEAQCRRPAKKSAKPVRIEVW
jgi:hypothetical protein